MDKKFQIVLVVIILIQKQYIWVQQQPLLIYLLMVTSECDESQNFIVVVEDNYGQSYEMEFDLNNENVDEEPADTPPME